MAYCCIFSPVFKQGPKNWTTVWNLNGLTTDFGEAKTPWSWGRMHNILSEGREIESRRQLEEPAIALRSKCEEFGIGNETGMPARERPLTGERARSNRTRSQARKG